MGIKLRFDKGLDWRVKFIIGGFVKAAREVLDIQHSLPIYVKNKVVVAVVGERRGFGAFCQRNGKIHIALAGDLEGSYRCFRKKAPNITKLDVLGLCMLHTLSHELGHYEQYRDDKPLLEYDADRRARRILRLVTKQQQKIAG